MQTKLQFYLTMLLILILKQPMRRYRVSFWSFRIYARFFRWATDRLHDDGILAFVTNRSFIDKRTFDGFRKTVAEEFQAIYVVDLGGDIRDNPKLSGTVHNVFGIQTGVAISFFVKKTGRGACNIHYCRRPEFENAIDKLAFLSSTDPSTIAFEPIRPDKDGDWLDRTSSDWADFAAVADNVTKRAKKPSQQQAIFSLFSTGIMSGRDEWVYDISRDSLDLKMTYFQKEFAKAVAKGKPDENAIKWSRNLKRKLSSEAQARDPLFEEVLFRPFVVKKIWLSKIFVDELGAMMQSFRGENLIIAFLSVSSANPVAVMVSKRPVDYGLLKAGNGGTQCLFRFRYSKDGEKIDNITDWALNRFLRAYGKNGNLHPNRAAKDEQPPVYKGQRRASLSKADIFHYVYGVLHDPIYGAEYAADLRKQFPRLPFKDDFWSWAEWGAELMALHLGFETVTPWPLDRTEKLAKLSLKDRPPTKVILRADHAAGKIRIDSETTLEGIPPEAWRYKLGNRSALDWVPDQYKERTPRDPVIINEGFDSYEFAEKKKRLLNF